MEIARRHPTAFAATVDPAHCRDYRPAWYHYLLGDDLKRVALTAAGIPCENPIDRLIVVMPPRHGKTETVTVRFPVWAMSEFGLDIMALTYGASLAVEFGTKGRNVVESPMYQKLYPHRLKYGSSAKTDWRLDNYARYTSISLKGSVTGKGAPLLILDDLYKNSEQADSAVYREWVKDQYSAVAYTRLEPPGCIVACMTHWHNDDWIGWQLREFEDEGWVIRHLCALQEAA